MPSPRSCYNLRKEHFESLQQSLQPHHRQEIRTILKKTNGMYCTERHDYQDIERPGKDKVVLVKLVSGQGAMYDTHYLAPEPSGFIGSHSIIDSTGSPMIISPNEYRDGAIRALY